MTAHPAADQATAAALIDCDVHVYCPHGLADVVEHMPRAWRRRFELKGLELNEDALSYRFANPHEGGALRRDSVPPSGGPPGSDPAFLIEDHLDRHGIGQALTNSLQALSLAAVQAQPDESVVLCTAFNDYFIERFLSVDPRLLYGPVIPAQAPVEAAAEIRRLAADDHVVALYFPVLNLPMGHRFFHPIYDAAQETGLPIFVHPSSVDFIFQGAAVNPAGFAESYAEMYAGLPVVAWSNLQNLILSGTLDRFPGLRLAFIEFGFAWVVPAMWRLDKAWTSCRHEIPWVTQRPSTYIRERMRFGTQPVDEPEDDEQLADVMGALGQDALIFCSDYPHWDGDSPGTVLRWPEPDHKRAIYAGNAAALLGCKDVSRG